MVWHRARTHFGSGADLSRFRRSGDAGIRPKGARVDLRLMALMCGCIARATNSVVMAALVPIRDNLRRTINLSVVIVRACGRSSNHGKSGFGTAVPQPALRRLLDAPLEAGQDNLRDRRGSLKLARMGLVPAIHDLSP